MTPRIETGQTTRRASVQESEPVATPARRWLARLPLLAFLALVGVFIFALRYGDPSRLPSVLIGKPLPEFVLPAIEGLDRAGTPVPGLASAELAGTGPHVVNVWASWCGPCRIEHPQLETLAQRSRVPLHGINYKDRAADARRFLDGLGNPFERVGVDASGRTAIDLGVYGVPETFLVDARGNIAYRHVGPITPQDLDRTLLPLLDRLKAGEIADPSTANGAATR
ncbi:MAG: DsbE family thiol:disulfide interchange protein [Rhizobiales bacterium]|nr:DsbE family thiol:disulfide interchange protein [Hyphomicrobiales bacterium]